MVRVLVATALEAGERTAMDKPSEVTPPVSGAGPAAAADDLTGRTLGDFRVLRCLGQGGMGQVYLAEQISLRRKVALKFLRADLAANPTSLQRFKAEAEAVARVTHANILQVYWIGEAAGLHFMALEYVDGRNLAEYLEKKGPPGVLLALSIMRQVASALQRAGEVGLIHRDIKPENILLTRKGEVKVADFGLSRCLAGEQRARLTQSGVTMGTPLYMSPEQVQGEPVDSRTDIYSFGVTCYHMLAGQPPFRGDNPFEVALRHVNDQPEPLAAVRPDLPPELCAIIHKMMAREPGQRYQTGRDLIRDLARLRERLAQSGGGEQTGVISLDSAPALPAAPGTPVAGLRTAIPVPVPPRRRLLPAVVLSLLAALACGAGAGWLWREYQAAPQEPAPAADGDTAPAEAPLSLAKREQSLKERVEEYANPGKDPLQVRNGLGQLLELGLFYLDQGRLEDADRLFTRLMDRSQEVKPYRYLGVLGHAIVLGLQSRPEQSNELLLQLLVDSQPPGAERRDPTGPLGPSPRLHQWLATALDYNKANETPEHRFPEKLERFRHPPNAPVLPRGGADKPPAKKP
jgi:serine/threonine-protein kinase